MGHGGRSSPEGAAVVCAEGVHSVLSRRCAVLEEEKERAAKLWGVKLACTAQSYGDEK